MINAIKEINRLTVLFFSVQKFLIEFDVAFASAQ